MKQESLAFEGIVLQELGNSMFRVELDMAGSHEITCTISGKIRKNFIEILAGDRVLVEMSPYDLTKGRIERRLSDRGDAELINNSKTSKKKKK